MPCMSCLSCLEVGFGLGLAGWAVRYSEEAHSPARRGVAASTPVVPGAASEASSSNAVPETAKPPPAVGQPLQEVCFAVAQQLPPGPRVCILGGTAFKDPDSELIVKSLAKHFARNLASSVVVLTGGMQGVQETFARSMGVEVRRWSQAGQASEAGSPSSGEPRCQTDIVNLLPAGQASGYGVGRDVEAGADLEERKKVFAELGHIYLTVEGGPGVSQEASTAFSRGAVVLPISSTGGASSGMFGFPAQALERPAFATQEQWDRLQNKGDPDETALAVVQIIWTLISKGGVVGMKVGIGADE